jgi:proline iminopeptidase
MTRRPIPVAVAIAAALLLQACERPPAREGFVPVAGGRIWYRIVSEGPGTPLIFVHGGPGSTGCRGIALAALGDRPVIIYDQLGSGRSDHPTDTTLWRLERFVEEIDSLRAHLRLPQVHLYGGSWGATVAAEYALTRPGGGLRSLTLAGPLLSTPRWMEDAAVLRGQLPAPIQATLARHESAGTVDSPEYLAATDSFYARFFARRPQRPNPDCPTSLNTDVYRYMWGPTEFYATGTLRSYDRFDRLSELRLPVLLMTGEYDEARPETVRRYQQRIPGARFEEIEGSGHAILSDEPDQVVTAVNAFLSEVEGP